MDFSNLRFRLSDEEFLNQNYLDNFDLSVLSSNYASVINQELDLIMTLGTTHINPNLNNEITNDNANNYPIYYERKYLKKNYKYLPEDLKNYFNKYKNTNNHPKKSPYFYKIYHYLHLRKIFKKKIIENKNNHFKKSLNFITDECLICYNIKDIYNFCSNKKCNKSICFNCYETIKQKFNECCYCKCHLKSI